MNHLKKLFSVVALFSFVATQANSVTPTLVYRSQGFHGDRQRNVGEVGHTNVYDMDSWYGTMDMGVGFMRSFRNNKIARCLFGDDVDCNDDCSNVINVQGSGVASRDAKAWLADYLYLNCDYDGSFSLKPLIQNVVVDLDFYLGLNEWVDGGYFRVYGPINWSKWETRFAVNDPATVLTTSCSNGYFTPSGNEVLLSSLADYFAGKAPASVDNITFQGLKWAKMPNCDETRTAFADLRAELGWNLVQDEDYHLGVGIHAAAPTGNKRSANYVMQPVVGNGNHWELGGTVHGHYVLWTSQDEEKQLGFYLDAVVTHLFKSTEQRTFDLKNKNNSRYMLASKFTKNVTNSLAGRPAADNPVTTNGSTAALSQFDLQYAPVANLTTADVKVDVGAQADVTAMLNFTSGRFSLDVGYNFWGRSCERIECPSECDPCNADSLFQLANANTWALKGDARMFGFDGGDDTPQALSASQSSADIHKGTNAGTVDATLTNVTLQNGGVDNSQFAIVDGPERLIHTPTAQGGFDIVSNQIKTSIQPVFLGRNDVELQQTKGLSHTVFAHMSYTFDRDEWVPYVGLGGSAEFGKNESNCDTDCDTSPSNCKNCIDCSLSQWSVWLKGGVSFN